MPGMSLKAYMPARKKARWALRLITDNNQRTNFRLSMSGTNEGAIEKEEEYVHQVYQDIASHFSSTRYKVRKRVSIECISMDIFPL